MQLQLGEICDDSDESIANDRSHQECLEQPQDQMPRCSAGGEEVCRSRFGLPEQNSVGYLAKPIPSVIHTNHVTKMPRVNQRLLELKNLFRVTGRLRASTVMSLVHCSNGARVLVTDVRETLARRSLLRGLQVLEGFATKAIAGPLQANAPERLQDLFHSQYCPTVAQSPSANWVDQLLLVVRATVRIGAFVRLTKPA